MAEENIGARLVLDPGTFLATIGEARSAVRDLQKDLTELGVTAEATMAKISKAGEGAAAGAAAGASATAKASTAETDAADAAVVGSRAHGKAIDETAAKTKAATAAQKDFQSSLKSFSTGTIASVGKYGLVGALGVAGESIDQYMKYQKAMTQLVTQAGLSASRLPAIMQGGLDIGKKTGLNFNDIANQLYRIVSATSGLKETNKQILALGQSAADIAVLFRVTPGAPTEQVARLFGSLANAGRSGKLQQTGGSPAGIAALLNAAVGTGDIRGQDLIGALGRGVLQAGQGVHAKLPDILTWLDLSTRLGAQPSTSGTLIAHAIQQLSGGTAQAKKVEAMAGIDPNEMANLIRTKGIGAAFDDLRTKLQTWNPLPYYPVTMKEPAGALSAQAQANAWLLANPTEMQSFYNNTASPKLRSEIANQLLAKMFGGARQEIPALTALENPVLWNAVESEIRAKSNSGQYNKDLRTALGTPSQQLDIAMRQLQAYSIELGKNLTPVLLKFVHGVVDAASWLNGHRAVLDAIGATLAAFVGVGVAAYAAGKIIGVIKSVRDFFTFLNKLNPLSKAGFGQTGLTGNTTALDENTGAITRLTDVMGVSGAEGGAGRGGILTTGEKGASEAGGLEADAAKAGLLVGRTGVLTTASALVVSIPTLKAMLQNKPPPNPLHVPGHHQVGQWLGWNDQGGWSGYGKTVLRDYITSPGKAIGHTATSYWDDLFGGGASPATPKLSPLQQAARTNANSIKLSNQSQYLNNELGQLNTIGTYTGTRSSQYQKALRDFEADVTKMFGARAPKRLMNSTPQQLTDWMAKSELPAQHKQELAAFYTDVNHQTAQKKLFFDALSGGSLQSTLKAISESKGAIDSAKKAGASNEHLSDLKKQLQEEQTHLKQLHEDMSKLTKSSDTKNAQNALEAAVKASGSTTNNLLQQILTSIRGLNLTYNTTNNGLVPTTASRNNTGAGK